MSLAAGPGRGGGAGVGKSTEEELELATDKHAAYIQLLDGVRHLDQRRISRRRR